MSPQTSQPEAPRAPCFSCECCHDLCPQSDQTMWCARLNKCFIVQALIFLVVLVHFAVSAKLERSIDESQPKPSDDLCTYPACSCSPPGYVYCNCSHYPPQVHKQMVLYSPAIIPQGTHLLHISNCDQVDIIKSPVRGANLVIPEWLAIMDVGWLILHNDSMLVGKKILIQSVGTVPELPTGILRLASLSEQSLVESFRMENTVVDSIKYHAFDSINLQTSFEILNVTIKSIEEGAINASIPSGKFIISNSVVWSLNSSTIQLKVKELALERSDFGIIGTKAITLKADTFRVEGNSFHDLIHKHAFDVQAKLVDMKFNRFKALDEQSFFKIRDHPNEDGNYVFTNNMIYSIPNGSFNPNRRTGENYTVSSNGFMNCSSSNIGWLWEAAYGPYVPTYTREFYAQLLNKDNLNACISRESHCSLEDIVQNYDPEISINIIEKFSGPDVNDEICQFLAFVENSSTFVEPSVIIFVQIVCFYLLTFLLKY